MKIVFIINIYVLPLAGVLEKRKVPAKS